MRKTFAVLLSLLALASVGNAAIMDEHPVLLNGKPFATASTINGIIAVRVEDVARGLGLGVSLEPLLALNGSHLKANTSSYEWIKNSPTVKIREAGVKEYTIKLRSTPLFRIGRAGEISSHVFMYGGKAWMPLADLAQAFGFIINWSNLRAGQAINVNAAANSNAILIGL